VRSPAEEVRKTRNSHDVLTPVIRASGRTAIPSAQ
jgi:hypothetical protein